MRVLLLLLLLMLPAACSSPFGDGDTKDTATSTAVATATVGSDATAPPGGSESPTILAAPEPPVQPEATGEQTLTLAGRPDGPPTLDPALVRDGESAFLARQVFRGLVRLDPQLNPVPDLAERIVVSPNGLSYTFHLYDEIRFHDGQPITAQDVKFSLERATDPALTDGNGNLLPGKTYLSDIIGAEDRMNGGGQPLTGVEVLDDRTVRISLVRPAVNFLLKLASAPASVVNRENVATSSEWWRQPNGSGPFKVTQWRDGEHIVLERHEDYRPNPPVLETVIFRLGVNALRPMTLYERGEIDAVRVPSDALDRVQVPSSPLQAELTVQPLLAGSYVLINSNIPPLDDPELRRALIQGFDREKIPTVTMNGQVTPAHGIVPPGMLGQNWPADLPPYDVDAAKGLVDTVTRDQGAPPELAIYTMGTWSPIAMQRVYERDLGLSVDVLRLEWSDYIHDLSTRQLPIFTVDWVADYPDPESFLRSLFHSQSSDNYLGYTNPEVDRLLDQAAVEQDQARRAMLYQHAQQQIIDDGVVIPLYFDIGYMLNKPYVHGLHLTPIGILGLETVWLTR